MRINKAGGGIRVYREGVSTSGEEGRTFELGGILKISLPGLPVCIWGYKARGPGLTASNRILKASVTQMQGTPEFYYLSSSLPQRCPRGPRLHKFQSCISYWFLKFSVTPSSCPTSGRHRAMSPISQGYLHHLSPSHLVLPHPGVPVFSCAQWLLFPSPHSHHPTPPHATLTLTSPSSFPLRH